MKYLISHGGVESGPFTLDEIDAKIRAKELELFDYIFDEAKNDWILLTEHEGVTAKLKSNKPSARPKAVTETKAVSEAPVTVAFSGERSQAGNVEWFVLKGEHKFGPFRQSEVIKMMQEKVLFPFDFVWHQGLKDWTRIAETQDFSEQQIKSVYEKGEKGIFQHRQFERQPYQGRVFLHDNMKLWKAEGFEISKGGVGILMQNNIIIPGQHLQVHLGGHGAVSAFNARCEVVSKKFVNDSSPVEYGLRFISLSPEDPSLFAKKAAK